MDRKHAILHVVDVLWSKYHARGDVILLVAKVYDDVIKWKHFRVTDLCADNSPVTGEFPSQRPVTQSFDVFFDLRPNKR